MSGAKTSPNTESFGQWISPISIDDTLTSGVSYKEIAADGSVCYWLESRPKENSRSTLIKFSAGKTTEVTPAPFSVRNRVHEYGGGSFSVRDQTIVFCDDNSKRLYLATEQDFENPTPITLASSQVRFADLQVYPKFGVLLAVREDHRGPGEAETTLVALRLDTENTDFGTVLASGSSFYANPTLSEDGRLAWIEWDHPNMPWDDTRLLSARLIDQNTGKPLTQRIGVDSDEVLTKEKQPSPSFTLREKQLVFSQQDVCVVHPKWSPNGDLFAMCDENGFWNLHKFYGDKNVNVCAAENDFDSPMWNLGNQSWAFVNYQYVFAYRIVNGWTEAGFIDLSSGNFCAIDLSLAECSGIASGDGSAYLLADFADSPAAILRLTPSKDPEVLAVAGTKSCDPALTSTPVQYSFKGEYGLSHAWFFPPKNTAFTSPEGELPPLIIQVHGGPTAFASPSHDLQIQFWTSRGFAYCLPNYSGSTGFGRAYRNRLRGNWGVADLSDITELADSLSSNGLVDPNKIVITGGSAGGYAVLQALTSTTVFTAGVCRYGVADIEMLATDTHKFESHYLDLLVAPYPDQQETYVQRSPITHIDQLASPILLLQGLEDKVVPPSQTEMIANVARERKLPVALLMFDQEGHGFRQLSTRRAVLEAQISFFNQILGIEIVDNVPKLEIENL